MSQFAGFTVDNGAIKDLRDLLFYTLYKDPQRPLPGLSTVKNWATSIEWVM